MSKRLKYKRPKGVPRNYIQQIAENLNQKGFTITYLKTRDVLRGKYADVDLVQTVLQELSEVRDAHQLKIKEVAALRKTVKRG